MNFDINQNTFTIAKNIIPTNAFGVFVTVRRSKYHKTKEYPEDIHGCHGYWDPNYKIMAKNQLLEKIQERANSATWQDSRKNYFPPIYTDSCAQYEIDFMMYPPLIIEQKTGIFKNGNKNVKFDNDKYGLIVESPSGHRATYLPHVFPGETWKYIINRLTKKAGISDKSNYKFYAYNAIIYKKQIIRLLEKNYLYYLLNLTLQVIFLTG